MQIHTAIVFISLFTASLVQAAIVPFTNTVANPCNGESVLVEGRLNVFTRGNIFHVNTVNVKGIGNLGNEYVVSQHLQSVSKPTPGASVSTSELTLRVVSKSGTDNFLVHNLVHTTITPNGDLTASVLFLSSECRG